MTNDSRTPAKHEAFAGGPVRASTLPATASLRQLRPAADRGHAAPEGRR